MQKRHFKIKSIISNKSNRKPNNVWRFMQYSIKNVVKICLYKLYLLNKINYVNL